MLDLQKLSPQYEAFHFGLATTSATRNCWPRLDHQQRQPTTFMLVASIESIRLFTKSQLASAVFTKIAVSMESMALTLAARSDHLILVATWALLFNSAKSNTNQTLTRGVMKSCTTTSVFRVNSFVSCGADTFLSALHPITEQRQTPSFFCGHSCRPPPNKQY